MRPDDRRWLSGFSSVENTIKNSLFFNSFLTNSMSLQIYNEGSKGGTMELEAIKRKRYVYLFLSALSFLVFNLLCAPCFAAIGAIRREMNNGKWTWFAIGYQ